MKRIAGLYCGECRTINNVDMVHAGAISQFTCAYCGEITPLRGYVHEGVHHGT